MKDKKDDSWFEVYGQTGVKFMKDGKYYDNKKNPVELDADGNVIPFVDSEPPKEVKKEKNPVAVEKKEPEPSVVTIGAIQETKEIPESPTLELIDRIKIKSPADPNFLKKAMIAKELRKRNVDFSYYTGREKMLEALKESMGLINVTLSEDD